MAKFKNHLKCVRHTHVNGALQAVAPGETVELTEAVGAELVARGKMQRVDAPTVAQEAPIAPAPEAVAEPSIPRISETDVKPPLFTQPSHSGQGGKRK
jgi:hypothetical protein